MVQTVKLYAAVLGIGIALQAQTVNGHYKWTVIKWTEYDGERVMQKFWQWVPPADCTSWPKGFVFAGGQVYDKRGCVYPKLDGACRKESDSETLPPDCSEHPPFLPPSKPKPEMIHRKDKS